MFVWDGLNAFELKGYSAKSVLVLKTDKTSIIYSYLDYLHSPYTLSEVFIMGPSFAAAVKIRLKKSLTPDSPEWSARRAAAEAHR